MFRKEYIQANDNIKVDQELLEKTLETAFSGKQKRKVYSYRPMTSVAAAVVLVIGCSIAYPNLVNKPVIENTEPVVTIAPVGDEFLPVVEETVAPQKTKSPAKKVLETSKPVEVVIPEQPSVAEETAPAVETEPVSENVPSVARFIHEPVAEESFEQQLNLADGYLLKEEKEENYVFEKEDGKRFSVIISESEEFPGGASWEETETGINLTFSKDGKIYNVKSENMSKAELTAIFSEFIN